MTPLVRHPNHRDPASLPAELRRTGVPSLAREWVRAETGRAVVGVRRLAGASSSAVHALTLSDGSRLVLRRYAWAGFLDEEPLAPGREVVALTLGTAAGLPVPAVVAADRTGAAVGDGVPALLMSLLPGRAIALPHPSRLAEVAAAIHEVDATGFAHGYFRWYAATMTPPAATSQPALWESAIGLWHDAMPPYEATFIHRDFHPGNLLVSRSHPTGVVDWANACRGPRGCDVATCRQNLVDLGGPDGADAFQRAYESITGTSHHPYWELARILEAGPSASHETDLAEVEVRLAELVASLR
ncbi:MAG: hypothetical protein QOE35_2848 [Actinomycetota bacterium]|jgi:aminoglycoside phosphotransferase (APT) family kinase protein